MHVNLLLESLDAAATQGVLIAGDNALEGKVFIWKLGNAVPCFLCSNGLPVEAPQGERMTSRQFTLCQKRGDVHAPHRIEVRCPDAHRIPGTEEIEHLSICASDGEIMTDPCGPADFEELREGAILCGPITLRLGSRK